MAKEIPNRRRISLLIILLLIVANFILVLPNLNYSPIPTEWSVGAGWGRYYIIHYGHIPRPIKALTWQSALKNYGAIDVMPKILAATINIITGTTTLISAERFHRIFVWPALIIPIFVISLLFYMTRRKRYTIKTLDIILLSLFSIFPLGATLFSFSYGASGLNPIARAFFVLVMIQLMIIIETKFNDIRRMIIFSILIISFFDYYHTWSYYFVIYFVTTNSILILTNKEQYPINKILIFTTIVMVLFFSISLYLNFRLLQQPIEFILNIQFILSQLNNYISLYFRSPYVSYSLSNSMYGKLQILNGTMILVVLLIFLLHIRKKYKEKREIHIFEKTILYFLIAQVIIYIGLFFWAGVLGVYSRFFESLIYITILASTLLFAETSNKIKSILRITISISITLAVISYLVYAPRLTWSITNGEFDGLEFAGEHIPKTSPIFSDFRYGPPLIYFNQLAIKTVDSLHNSKNITLKLLNECYYKVNNPSKILDGYINSKNYFAIFSPRQSKIPIVDPSLRRFKPASKDFLERWNAQSGFDKIYSGEIVLFRRAVT